jgi:hypothetical protein
MFARLISCKYSRFWALLLAKINFGGAETSATTGTKLKNGTQLFSIDSSSNYDAILKFSGLRPTIF